MNNKTSTIARPQSPDKPDTHDMVVVHRIFRREIRQAADLVLQAPAGDLRRAAVIARHLDLLLEVLQHHHEAEDEYLWPLLLERATLRGDLVHRVEYQHDGIARGLAGIEILLPRWRRSAAASVAGELSSALRLLSRALVEHMDEEEQQILPLVAETLTVAEWQRLGEIAYEKGQPSQRFTVLGLLLAEASRAETAEFLGKIPAIARVLWTLVARRRFVRYLNRVHGDALL
ncbi:MAG TPA: hemerythrin domain-containing protein [Pseudonocardiaceae bacterium]|nr:hemerythrin domain-containing protein [Pseudonocardiaceae bacterium]